MQKFEKNVMVGEMSVWGNVLVGKCSVEEVSSQGSVLRGSIQSGNCPFGDLSTGKCQSGKCPVRKLSYNPVKLLVTNKTLPKTTLEEITYSNISLKKIIRTWFKKTLRSLSRTSEITN